MILVLESHGKYVHEFKRCAESGLSKNLNASDFREQEYVVISSKDRVNLCSGFIRTISDDSVTVLIDRLVIAFMTYTFKRKVPPFV